MTTNWCCTYSLSASVSGSFTENTEFVHKIFPVPPAKWAMIEVDVSYLKVHETEKHYLIMGIYTTEDNVDMRRRCIHTRYGQLGNKNLYPVLTMNQSLSGHLRCETNNQWLHCKGRIPIQDYTPRNYSFSFGYLCGTINSLPDIGSDWIPNLHYKMTIHVTNKTVCHKLPAEHTCHRHMKFGAFPNLLGETKIIPSLPLASSCLQLLPLATKFFCYLFIPRCDPESNQIISPCKEMCYDYLNACGNHSGNMEYINCDYLPLKNEKLPCFYMPLGCSSQPPSVEYATVITNFTVRGKYLFPNIMEYICNKGYTMKGNRSVLCGHDGQWSTLPQCSPKYKSLSTTEQTATAKAEFIAVSPATSIKISTKLFLIGALLLGPLVILFVIVTVRSKIKIKRKRKPELMLGIELKKIEEPLAKEGRKDLESVSPLKRNRTFDATIFYHFDTDDNFVLDSLLPELEETRKFNLCIHSRDFTPGRDIKDNIQEAIEGSNSAIIVMSQGFVDSIWCKEEFTHCYIENMKDAAFNLFVIMMQPADTLVNISRYMTTFFETKTYLLKDDSELFVKLAAHLENGGQLENDNVNDNGTIVDKTNSVDDDQTE